MAALSRLKRGSVQLQRAALKASGRVGARQRLALLVLWAVALCGVVEHAHDTLRGELPPNSTSLAHRYCSSTDNATQEVLETTASQERVQWAAREGYLWGFLVSPGVASKVAGRLGACRVLGVAVLVAGVLMAPLPFLQPDSAYAVVLRVVQGSAVGCIWPALHMLGSAWYPPLQRTTFVSYYSAITLGRSLGPHTVGRDWASYALAVSAVLWFVLWHQLATDRPSQHPHLSPDKKHKLQVAIGNTVAHPSVVAPLPWRKMLTSSPLWTCAVAQLGGQWGQATLHLAATKYLRQVYGFPMTRNRVLTLLPPVGHMMMALALAPFIDHARSVALVSTTTARRLMVYFGHFPTGAILFVLGFSGCSPSVPAILYILGVVFSGAMFVGACASAMDIAPNYAGPVFALVQTFGAAGSLAGSYIVNEGLHGTLPGSWRLVFGSAALVLALSAMLFFGYGSGRAQPWNHAIPTADHAPPDDQAPVNIEDADTPQDQQEEGDDDEV